jgi:hypothetical protein
MLIFSVFYGVFPVENPVETVDIQDGGGRTVCGRADKLRKRLIWESYFWQTNSYK